jgi:hypothetical protein
MLTDIKPARSCSPEAPLARYPATFPARRSALPPRADSDAENRAAKEVADAIRMRLASHFIAGT